jgi:hypothetical protein
MMNTWEIVGWICTAVSLAGAWLNVKKVKWCFVLWLFSNAFWTVYDIYKQAYPQAVIFGIYFLTAVWGIREWFKKDAKNTNN